MSALAAKANASDFYAARFAETQARLPGSDVAWLAGVRRRAVQSFVERGFPSTRDEAWKYSSLALLERRQYAPASAPALADPRSVAQYDVCGGDLLVFVNGQFAPSLSRVPAGARVSSVAQALADDAHSLQDMLSAEAKDGVAALNAAFFTDGACIRLADGARLDAPLHLLFIANHADCAIHPRNLLVAGEGSRASVIEHYVGAHDIGYWTNARTSVRLGANAQLHHINVLQQGAKAYHTAAVEVEQSAGSEFTSHSIALGGLFARTQIDVRLAGERSACTLNGLYVTQGREHVDFHTSIDHLVEHGVSREFFKGVLGGASRAVFNGKVIVHPGAQHTDAQQSNRNLLLSEDAEIDTKPQLEIFADDVKCSHGATIGQLDESQVFYLRARGLSEQAARNVLTYAFCEEIIAQLPLAGLRTHLNQALLGRLPDGDKLTELL